MTSPSSEEPSLSVLVGRLGRAIDDLDPGGKAHLRQPASPTFEETWLALAVRVLEPADALAPTDYGGDREKAWRALAIGIAIAGHQPGRSMGENLAEARFPLARLRGLLADQKPDVGRWTFELATFLQSRKVVPNWTLWAALLLAVPARRTDLLTDLRRDYLAALPDRETA